VLLSPADRESAITRLRAAGCVFAEDEARLLADQAGTPAEFGALVAQRAAGLPIEHVVGWAEFCGLRIAVDRGVFVPRRRTEFLVTQAAAVLGRLPGAGADAGGRGPVVVDMCCGSGAVGVALLRAAGGGEVEFPVESPVELHAADIDPAAVRCARRNLGPAGGLVHEGDLYEALPGTLAGRVDVLVANVPYVPTGEVGLLPPEARLHEPRVALDGGTDGLDVLRRVAVGAAAWLAPGGCLLIETSARQARAAAGIAVRAGLAARVITSADLAATVLSADKPRASNCPFPGEPDGVRFDS
jgi:release factor glutamine methyltransferase